MAALQGRLGYRFQDESLLQQALTHRSFGAQHNERLEFLGDSVLGLCVAQLLYAQLGQGDEGELSRVRASLVRQATLHHQAEALQLADALRLGEGEARSGGRSRPSILADAFEAVLGAMFLDGGLAPVQALVQRLFGPLLSDGAAAHGKDAKTALQEWVQGRKLPLPTYRVVATAGAAHEQTFEVEAVLPADGRSASGRGASKRQAEQAAAQALLTVLREA
ncbi:MAG: ribonuclease III [Betaproteobacteria bacterium]|nr:ribonuclease III [Betaproteobacteria bacterium]MDE2047641.1 ribonuclease III [Betaproteobacteria bacterium]